jgi:FkbM family methyltransferase
MMPTLNMRKDIFRISKLFHLANRLFQELKGVNRISGKRIFFIYLSAIFRRAYKILGESSLRPADDLMTNKTLCLTPLGKEVKVDGKHFNLVREIYCSNCYFPPLPEFTLQNNDMVMDLGCNVGIFTVLSAKFAKQVLAVDAQSRFLTDLKTNLAQNGCLEKVTFQLALVGSGSGVFSDPKKLKTASHYGVPPPMVSMNDLCELQRTDRIDFLKIDIEGSEFDLFSVNTQWLERVGKIAMEVHQDYGELDSIIGVMKAWGFKIWIQDKKGRFVDVLEDSTGYLYARRACEGY